MQRPDIVPVQRMLQALVLRGCIWTQGGVDPATGLGCYGLVYLAFHFAGIELPQTAEAGAEVFVQVQPPYQSWDMVLSRIGEGPMARHVGLLVAPTWGYHCSWMSNGVAQFDIHKGIWRRVIRHGLRYRGFLTGVDMPCPASIP
jgi:cell wall-associated NlpC family hydrolase